jgi:hypothetical protein
MSKAGGGKAKGADFERYICKRLSKWISRGRRTDLFWRSAMSGGRATLQMRGGVRNRTQAGDITAIDPEGSYLTKFALLECKSYKLLHLLSLETAWAPGMDTARVNYFWHRVAEDAGKHDRAPMLIAKQNVLGEFVILNYEGVLKFELLPAPIVFSNTDAHVYRLDTFFNQARRP